MASLVKGIFDKTPKVKGTVVLMQKNVLDINELTAAQSPGGIIGGAIGAIGGIAGSILDTATSFLGRSVALKLISATSADASGKGIVGKETFLEGILTSLPTLGDKQSAFAIHFEWDTKNGIPGAFYIRNYMQGEFFLVSLSLDDVPNVGTINFVCNSWIYNFKNYKTDRIFFANKTYLPSATPAPLVYYRQEELKTLRGDGTGERKEYERIYDYDVYNDLGEPDKKATLASPVLGGSSTLPYPRRGRTGRKPTSKDPKSESRSDIVYLPRDEAFGHVKSSDFLVYILKSASQNIVPQLRSVVTLQLNNPEFNTFEDVRSLYDGGIKLPTDILSQISPIPLFKELFRSDGESALKFPPPKVIQVDHSAWMTDAEFAREMIAGVNPHIIKKLLEFPPKSKLDSQLYGDNTSTITKENLEPNLDGVTVEQAIQNNRLYILDHHDTLFPYLRKINATETKAYATRTILFLQNDGTLKPLAIELSRPHPQGDSFGPVSNVYLPASEGVEASIWLLAKAFVIVNDSCYHQLVSHWLNTHAVVEPFIIATNRHLSVVHPIHKLLLPHYRDTMNINALARNVLVNAEGIIESTFLWGGYALEMSAVVYKDWVFTEQGLPNDLIKRGVAVEDAASPYGVRLLIEDYPYSYLFCLCPCPCGAMEQENQHQVMIVHDNNDEEVDDFALKRKDDNLVTNVVVTPSSTSSSDSMSNGDSRHHSNGRTSTIVTDPDESSLQKEEEVEEKRNVGECNSDFGDDKEEDCVPVGLGLVAEFVEQEATNGEEVKITDATLCYESSDILQNKYNVYFDKQQGNEVNGHNRVQNGDATKHEKSKFDEQVENSDIQNSLSRKVENQHMSIVVDKVPSGSEQSASHDSSDRQVTTPAANFCEETKRESDSKKEIDQQEKEFDVELVIAKQETHDLYCPNCKSCITKRVILKKRKRNIHVLDKKGKRDRLDLVVDDNVANSTTTPEVNQGDYPNVISEITTLEPPAAAAAAAADDDDDNDDHPDKEVEVFRCLSCFSIFIPSGKGFNLFRNFGGAASKQESSQNPSSITASNLQNSSNIPSSSSNQNWFISLFTSTKGKTATKQAGDTFHEPSRTGPADLHQSTITSTIPSSPDISHPEGQLADAAPIKNSKRTPDVNHGHGSVNSTISSNGVQSVVQDFIDFSEKEKSLTRKPRTDNGEKNKTSVDTIKTNTVEVTSSMNYSNGMVSEYKSVNSVTTTSSETFVSSRETTKGAIQNHYQEKPELLVPISVTVGSLIVENSPNDVNKPLEFVKNNDSSLRQGGAQSPFDSTRSPIDATFPSKMDSKLIEKTRNEINEKINNYVGKENNYDVIVDVDREANESTTLQTEDNVPVDGAIVTDSQTQVGIGAQPRDEIGEPKKWEIVKSIVYGGLVESITSLGIVSSAASSGATPLNIIALGFANLIGGLFILGHNLKELKDNHSRGQQQQTNIQDRYQEQLGSRSNFVFHAVIAVLSFLIFGSVPLIIYGVLINKNYYDEVKLAIVAATSVACIILLTIGKVYTARPPKSYIKTVLYYVTMALAASGISYIAGKLIKDLIDKFSHSESGFAITMPISETSMETAWMSY